MESREVDINKYVQWLQEGKTFSDVRVDLKTLGLPDDDIKVLINEIDNALIEADLNKQKGVQSNQLIMASKVAFAIGVIAAIAFAITRDYIALGIGITGVAGGMAFNKIARKLEKGSGSIVERPQRRKLNLKRD